LRLSNNVGNFCNIVEQGCFSSGNINHSHSSDKVLKYGAQTERTETKHLRHRYSPGQNIRRDKTFGGEKRPEKKLLETKCLGGTKSPEGQNILLGYI
jgi:hypothetical protein